MSSAAASLASGILDAISAGILIYAAMVELIGNEFIHSRRWMVCSWCVFLSHPLSLSSARRANLKLAAWKGQALLCAGKLCRGRGHHVTVGQLSAALD